VQAADAALVARWNNQAPSHPVELKSIQQALNEECSRIFLLMHELQKSVERTEGGS
jgi:RNase adaptor protein for sRNA GlmZ degradation